LLGCHKKEPQRVHTQAKAKPAVIYFDEEVASEENEADHLHEENLSSLSQAPIVDPGILPAAPIVVPPPIVPPPVLINRDKTTLLACGDGVRDDNEECDDGDNVSGDGCDEFCRREVCGNGVLNPDEGCDDGNTINGDGCSSTCLLESCGNGVVDTQEQCDNGHLTPGSGCNAFCRFEVCGNLFLDAGEQCDDGNTLNGDGCSAVCEFEGGLVAAICGNGQQQVSTSNPSCPFDIYGTTTDGPEGPSNLVGFNLSNNGEGTIIGVLGPDIERVSAIDFNKDGVLYGVGENSVDGDASVLFTINCQNADITIIGNTGIASLNGMNDVITDIDFDSFGRLSAIVATSTDTFFGFIDPLTGVYTNVGDTETFTSGNGLASSPFPNDNLYQAAGRELFEIDRATGESHFLTELIFPDPANDNPAINAMDNDPLTNIIYASVNDGERFLAVINPATSDVSLLSLEEAPDGLDGVTVNRRYEECDDGNNTSGDGCSATCANECEPESCEAIDPSTDEPYEGICASGLTACVEGEPDPDNCVPQFLPGDLPENCGVEGDEDCDGLADDDDPDCDVVSFSRLFLAF
jgi:cysteine-rich repeat protein